MKRLNAAWQLIPPDLDSFPGPGPLWSCENSSRATEGSVLRRLRVKPRALVAVNSVECHGKCP